MFRSTMNWIVFGKMRISGKHIFVISEHHYYTLTVEFSRLSSPQLLRDKTDQ